MSRTIRIGSRKSRLALIQSEFVKNIIEQDETYKCEIVTIDTLGDEIPDRPLPSIGDKGLFTKELEQQLLSGSIDIAVHSLKDLPTELPEGLKIGAVTKREDVRDVFLSPNAWTLDTVPSGGRIATGSLRRRVQVMRKRPDVKLEELRGNVPTRISKMASNNYSGIILAAAGVKRLGLQDSISAYFDIESMIPAAGQGAVGVEVMKDNDSVSPILARINDDTAALETTTERTILRHLEGSCRVPIGINARIASGKVRIIAFVSTLNGECFIKETIAGNIESIENLTMRLIDRLMARGARGVIEAVKRSTTDSS